jgi:hypothetical protein
MADVVGDSDPEGTTPPPAQDEAVNTDGTLSPNDRNARWRSRIWRCHELRRKMIASWTVNVDYRRGKQFDTDSDQDRIAIMTDWANTKAKQAQLFSQVPEVRLTPKRPEYKDAVPVFSRKLNEILTRARVGVAMDEALPDCINAAGVGAALISYESRTQGTRLVPVPPPEAVAQLQATGQPVPMQEMPNTTDTRFRIQRISPADLLWPIEFTGSDFDDASWLGRSGRMPWSDALHVFGGPTGLQPGDKELVVGGDNRTYLDVLTHGIDRERFREPDVVAFDEIFYWRHLFHPEETNFDAIQRLVFVVGKNAPVLDEPWAGQKRAGDKVLGSCKMPIRVVTLTYISDESIPPSDTAIGRSQVDELIRARSQMVRQRENSLPIRWFDVNRVAPEVQDTLIRGTWQGMIPMNGDGSRSVGEVARATYPREDFEFQTIAKNDLSESWQVTPAQGGGGQRPNSASEAQITQANFATRIGYERARVVKFFVGIAEVVGGLLSLFGEFSQEELQALGGWDREHIANYFVYTVRADSTVLLDADQRSERLMKFLNMTAKSGFVDVLPIITELAELAGLQPADVVRPPNPPMSDPLNVSLRLTGAHDLMDPMTLAMLLKSGQAPDAQAIAAARQLIQSVKPTQAQPSMLVGANGQLTPNPDAEPTSGPNTVDVMSGGAPLQDGGMPHVPALAPQQAPVGDSNPEWTQLSRIDTRTRPD